MITIDFETLNPLERRIHDILSEKSKVIDALRITDAAILCDCSPSKISKFTKKLGFTSYKQYVDFLCGREILSTNTSTELNRLQDFIREFDEGKVDEVAKLIAAHQKIVLLGYGPSFLCAQYIEYKLRVCANKIAVAVPDDQSASSVTDQNTLLLILTVTGAFRSFEDVCKDSKGKGATVAVIVEEYNPDVIRAYDKVFCLSRHAQSSDLMPFEKTRTVFFIFMEEVFRQLDRIQQGGRGRYGSVSRIRPS